MKCDFSIYLTAIVTNIVKVSIDIGWCLVTYDWEIKGWSDCPNDCGQKQGDHKQTRNVICVASDGSTDTQNKCDTNTKPDDSQSCPATDACGNIPCLLSTF